MKTIEKSYDEVHGDIRQPAIHHEERIGYTELVGRIVTAVPQIYADAIYMYEQQLREERPTKNTTQFINERRIGIEIVLLAIIDLGCDGKLDGVDPRIIDDTHRKTLMQDIYISLIEKSTERYPQIAPQNLALAQSVKKRL